MSSPGRLARHLLLVCFYSLLPGYCWGNPDSLQLLLPEVAVSPDGSQRLTPQSLGDTRVRWDRTTLERMPQVLGQADALRLAQLLPGVATSSEYDGGLHIYGSAGSHNAFTIGRVPIYNPSHLLGLFSAFNAEHYASFTLSKTAADATAADRLGGQLDLQLPQAMADTTSGTVHLGMIASQATVRMPLGRKSMLVLSGRASYVDLLYGYALRNDESQMRYSLADACATWLWQPGKRDRLWLDAYWSHDRAGLEQDRYRARLRLTWGNAMAAMHWEHDYGTGRRLRHTLHYTRFGNRFALTYPALRFTLPSAVGQWGYSALWSSSSLTAGIDVALHRFEPQLPQASESHIEQRTTGAEVQHAQHYAPHATLHLPLSHGLALRAGLRASLFVDHLHSTHWVLDPSLALTAQRHRWSAALIASSRHQFLYQSGFSSTGLPIESWLAIGGDIRPQSTFTLAATGSLNLPAALKLSLELYYKRMRHVVESQAGILDLVTTAYDPSRHQLQGNGHSQGLSIMLSRTSGRLTGWVSYSLCRARLRFAGSAARPALYERPHELNAALQADLGRGFSAGLTVVAASGTPYTPVEQLYLVAGNIVASYGEHASARLGTYRRVDLSATYRWRGFRGTRQGVNLSVYNALASRNELFNAWHVTDDNRLNYRPVSFIVRMMPSISYYVEF